MGTLENGNQPIESADGRYVVVFNGCIYNFLEIKIVFALQKPYVLKSLKIFFKDDLHKYETLILEEI